MTATISAERLADRVDSDDEFVLVDTRPAESYDAWHVNGAVNFQFGPEESLDARRDEFERAVDGATSVVTICAKGVSSVTLAEQLTAHGYEDVTAVKGGMKAWSQVYETVPIDVGSDLDVIQVQRRAKGCLGYVVGSPHTGVAAVVDPTRHTGEFVAAADARGYDITHVLDTHVHADHISGGRALADELGVPYHLGERANERDVEYEYEPLGRNEVLAVGDIELKALSTPGHTTEMVTYLIDDRALLTGDTLFVDSVGRTELQFGDDSAADGARLQHDSLHDVLMSEPDSLYVLPGHVTITDDGAYATAAPGEPVASTVGSLRRELDVLGLDRTEFVDRIASNIPDKPLNYETVIALNRGTETVEDEETTELELGPNRCAA